MKDFIKKNLWLPVAGGWLVCTAVCALFFPAAWAVIAAAVVTLAAAVLLGLYFLNGYCLKIFKEMAPPSYFKELTDRNLDAAAVGSTAAWQYLERRGGVCYDATGIRRSNTMCFNMLKTYFSHVHPGGRIKYIVDPAESESIGNYVSPCDYLHIHRLVFLYLDLSSPAKRRAWPAVYDLRFSIFTAWVYFAKKHGLQPASWKRSGNAPQLSPSLAEELKEIALFCDERELGCDFIFINRSAQDGGSVCESCRNALGTQENCSVTVVSDAAELNLAVYG